MKRPAWIFDTRSIIDVRIAEEIGFNVWQIGNSSRIKFKILNLFLKISLFKNEKKKKTLFFLFGIVNVFLQI